MKKLLLIIFVLFLLERTASATPPTPICYMNSTGTVCNNVTTSSPLPAGVYGGTGAVSGYVMTSNGPGVLATFQADGEGGTPVPLGTSSSVTNPQISGDQTSGFYATGTTGQVAVSSSGKEVMQWNPTTNAVNFLTISPAITTNAPIIAPTGGDTNIGLELLPKGTGGIGIGTATPAAILDMSANTGAVIVPVGTTGQEPGSPVNGMLRYNSTKNAFETYQNSGWTNTLMSSCTTVAATGATPQTATCASGYYLTGEMCSAATLIATNATITGGLAGSVVCSATTGNITATANCCH